VIFLIAYLTGYAICYPIAFKYILNDISSKPYDVEDVATCLGLSAFFNFFYPAFIVGILIKNFFIEPFVDNLNRSE